MFFAIVVTLLTTFENVASSTPQGPPFEAPRLIETDWMVDADVAVGDLNGDGVSDLIHANPGIALGANNVAFRAQLLEDDASQLSPVAGPMPAGTITLSCTVRAAVGDFDDNGFDDVVSLTYGLGLGICLNAGQSQSASGFGTSILIEDLAHSVSYAWPTMLRAPVLLVEDFDADGHLDVLVALALIDRANQQFSTPGMFVYFGRGDGTFERGEITMLPSSPIDADWVDRNGDGIGETLLFVGQTSTAGWSVAADVSWFHVVERIFTQVGAVHPLSQPQFVTSVAYLPDTTVPGAAWLLLAGHTHPVSYEMRAQLACVRVDAQGGRAAVWRWPCRRRSPPRPSAIYSRCRCLTRTAMACWT